MLSCTFRLLMVRFWGMSMEEVVKTSGKSTRCGTPVALNVTLRRSRFSRASRDGRKGAGRPKRHGDGCRGERAGGAARRGTRVGKVRLHRKSCRTGERQRNPNASARRTRAETRPCFFAAALG